MQSKSSEIIVAYGDLKKDEIAVSTEVERLFTVGSLYEVLKIYKINFLFEMSSTKTGEFVEVYCDDCGNGLILGYVPAVFRIPVDKKILSINGYTIEAEYYENGGSGKIDLCDILRFYPKNMFSKVVNELKNKAKQKEKEIRRIFV